MLQIIRVRVRVKTLSAHRQPACVRSGLGVGVGIGVDSVGASPTCMRRASCNLSPGFASELAAPAQSAMSSLLTLPFNEGE